jgi:hypothetical protein
VSRKTLQLLAALVVGLVLLLVVIEETDHTGSPQTRRLLPDLETQANSADTVLIETSDAAGNVTLHRTDDHWTVVERDGYPVDIAKLRSLMVALAGASVIEEKTSNPDLYAKLGLDDPADGGDGTKVTVSGDGFSETVILGKSAQRDFRYALVSGQATSYLIDKNPDIPKKIGGWLEPDVVDIPSKRVRRVSITHADGETIVIDKASRDLTDFTVEDVPAGRDLSYASVGNGIAAVLAKLQLEDVRAAVDAPAETTTVFDTWNGLRITAKVTPDGDDAWIAFSAEAVPVQNTAEPAPDNGGTADGETDTSGSGDDDTAAKATGGEKAPDAKPAEASPPAPDVQAAEINKRLGGWQYKVADYKKNLLTRRWKDILKAEPADKQK